MLSHALIQATMAVVNPVTIGGPFWTLRMSVPEFESGEIERRIDPSVPKGLRLVTKAFLTEEMLLRSQKSSQLYNKPFSLLAGLTLCLPVFTSVEHYGINNLPHIGPDLLATGLAHVAGFLISGATFVLATKVKNNDFGDDGVVVVKSIARGLFVGRFAGTFASAYYLTNWLG